MRCARRPSRPPIFYWKPGTLRVLEALRSLRGDGVEAWATIDAGAHVHVICPPRAERDVVECLKRVSDVRGVLLDGVGEGRARLVREGLSRLAESSILERYV